MITTEVCIARHKFGAGKASSLRGCVAETVGGVYKCHLDLTISDLQLLLMTAYSLLTMRPTILMFAQPGSPP